MTRAQWAKSFVRPELVPLYRARVERDHIARFGSFYDWLRAEALVREIETVAFTQASPQSGRGG